MSFQEYYKKRVFEKASIFTVASLIEELKKYPADAEVSVAGTADCHYIIAGGTYIQPVLSEDGKFLELFNDEDWDFYHLDSADLWEEEDEEEDETE